MKKSTVKRSSKVKRVLVRKPKSKSKIVAILTILVLGVIGYFAVSKLQMFTPTRVGINEVSVSSANVTLSLPSSISANPGTETSADITIDTGSSKVSAVQVELSYDVTKLSTPTLIQGDFLPEKLGNPKIKDGIISFIYTAPLGSNGKSGTGKLATLKFTPKNGNSQISFTKNTMVAAIGVSSNVLQYASGSSIVLAGSPQSESVTNPPVLTDIQPAPALTKPVSQNNPPSGTTPTTTTITTTQNSETVLTAPASFLPEKDYDYSDQTTPVDQAVGAIPTTSGFARFLAAIKTLFGGKQ